MIAISSIRGKKTFVPDIQDMKGFIETSKQTGSVALESELLGIVQARISERAVQLSMMNGKVHIVTQVEVAPFLCHPTVTRHTV